MAAETHQTDGHSAPCRIVVVEDNHIAMHVMSTWLKCIGHDVHTAADGLQALKLIESVNPSIVITDWHMPVMSGLELCRRIRSKRQKYVYVLMVTSRGDRRGAIQAIGAGADDFLVKPFEEEELLARVEQANATLRRLSHFAELAETDPLTGAMNRRHFQGRCVHEIARSANEGTALSCALFDIDLFKHINDTFGHSAGDTVLETFANIMRRFTQEGDCVCRYGGDEFIALLPGRNQDDARAFAERIRLALSESKVLVGDQAVRLRVTAGVAEWRQDIITPRQLIDLADEALLVGKRAGRNRVVGHGDLNELSCFDHADQHSYRSRFANVIAGDIMTTPIVPITQDQSISIVADLFLRLRITSVPVVDHNSALVGIISEADVLDSVAFDSDWTRPTRECMKRDVVAYDVTTPVTEILDFFRHVTLRRVAIVRDGVPVGVISRGTLLRWIGNWGVLLDRYGRGDNTNGLELLCSHIQLAASTIALEAEQFQHDVVKSAEHAVPCAINAATRLQDQAQDLLALCQVHYQFNPQPSPNPPPSPCGLSSA